MRISSIRNIASRAASAATVAALTVPVAVFAAAGANPTGAAVPGGALKNLKQGMADTGAAAGVGAAKSLPELVGSYVQQAMGLLGIVLVVLVIYAGFLWMTAQGSEEKIKKAKGIITSAVIGIVLIFAAYSITGFVVDALNAAQS